VIHGLIQQRLANLNSLIVETQTMTKKNLKPQQIAPVQREINATSSVGGTGLTPLWGCTGADGFKVCTPFAGDEAE
jgi:prenylated cyclic peptide (anacyclamide/piricyclamide family)